jgi:hypothetical protein
MKRLDAMMIAASLTIDDDYEHERRISERRDEELRRIKEMIMPLQLCEGEVCNTWLYCDHHPTRRKAR